MKKIIALGLLSFSKSILIQQNNKTLHEEWRDFTLNETKVNKDLKLYSQDHPAGPTIHKFNASQSQVKSNLTGNLSGHVQSNQSAKVTHTRSISANRSINSTHQPVSKNLVKSTAKTEVKTTGLGIPVIIFGGMGQKCDDPGIQLIAKNLVGNELQSSHVECFASETLKAMKSQAEGACEFMTKNENFSKAKEINVIGISQGGLIGRAFVQQCTAFPSKIRNFLTIGSPHMGIAEIPRQKCD